jgi:hypothetical protein
VVSIVVTRPSSADAVTAPVARSQPAACRRQAALRDRDREGVSRATHPHVVIDGRKAEALPADIRGGRAEGRRPFELAGHALSASCPAEIAALLPSTSSVGAIAALVVSSQVLVVIRDASRDLLRPLPSPDAPIRLCIPVPALVAARSLAQPVARHATVIGRAVGRASLREMALVVSSQGTHRTSSPPVCRDRAIIPPRGWAREPPLQGFAPGALGVPDAR